MFPTLKKIIICILVFSAPCAGCNKLVDVGVPESQLDGSKIFANDQSAMAALMGMYARGLSMQGSFLCGGISVYASLSADECKPISGSAGLQELYDNSLQSNNSYVKLLYSWAYTNIYNANTILENVRRSPHITDAARRILIGEASFFRAYVYSLLLPLFGPVPIVTVTDPNTSANIPRSAIPAVYELIVADLLTADSLLGPAYAARDAYPDERIRPNKWAAEVLLARTYLYCGRWAAARNLCDAIINSGQYRLESSLDSVFVVNSKEAIWQLQPPDSLPAEANYFAADPMRYAASANFLLAIEPADLRMTHWLKNGSGGYYPNKYRSRSNGGNKEYCSALRLAEVYLIRAEASVRMNDLVYAALDLSQIRGRAGLPAVNGALDQDGIFSAIMHERRIELFSEWGHRWIDIKRWGIADTVLRPIKKEWQSSDTLYPLPQTELQRNPALQQNAGY